MVADVDAPSDLEPHHIRGAGLDLDGEGGRLGRALVPWVDEEPAAGKYVYDRRKLKPLKRVVLMGSFLMR